MNFNIKKTSGDLYTCKVEGYNFKSKGVSIQNAITNFLKLIKLTIK